MAIPADMTAIIIDGKGGPEVLKPARLPVPQPGNGQILVKVLFSSLDPAMRGWMNDGKSYIPPVGIGEKSRALMS